MAMLPGKFNEKQQQGGNILVQGSAKLVKLLLGAGLADELKLLVQPHLMGTGSRLFPDELNIGLEYHSLQELDKGVVAISYRPAKF